MAQELVPALEGGRLLMLQGRSLRSSSGNHVGTEQVFMCSPGNLFLRVLRWSVTSILRSGTYHSRDAEHRQRTGWHEQLQRSLGPPDDFLNSVDEMDTGWYFCSACPLAY